MIHENAGARRNAQADEVWLCPYSDAAANIKSVYIEYLLIGVRAGR